MKGSVVVVLYSKYSDECNRFFDMTGDMLEFKKLCIDNETVRKIISIDPKKYNVKMVPTVFIFFSDGIVKKYEGDDAFAWAQDTMNAMRRITENTMNIMNKYAEDNVLYSTSVTPTSLISDTSTSVTPTSLISDTSTSVTPTSLISNTSTSLMTDPSTISHPSTIFNNLYNSPETSTAFISPETSDGQSKDDEKVPDHRRTIDTEPLISKKESEEAARMDSQEVRGIKSTSHDSILNIAQKLQKQREEQDGNTRKEQDANTRKEQDTIRDTKNEDD